MENDNNMNLIKRMSECVALMDEKIRYDYSDGGEEAEKKLWENTFIYHQICERREGNKTFHIEDHIRAMVYSFLSSGVAWNRYGKDININTGEIESVDCIFHKYDPEWLLECPSENLINDLKTNGFLSQYTNKQMKALKCNIKKFKEFDKYPGGIDAVYKKYLNDNEDSSLISLVTALSDGKNKEFKMIQMGEALAAEYLRNVGFDLPKPDRHIRRILGCEILACSQKKEASVKEVFDIIPEIAKEIGKYNAEVDYILWSYCASGYGEICTKRKPKCEICVVKKYCEAGI